MKPREQLKYLKCVAKKTLLSTTADPKIYIFSYHKVGTKLLAKIFKEICWDSGWKFKNLAGTVKKVPSDLDVVIFLHSQIDLTSIDKPFLGIHLRRDPRDVLVSGYLYHQRTDEAWCLNTNFEINGNIKYPQVPFSQEHRSEGWKRSYLNNLGGLSYQENLKKLGQKEGLLFEMERYADWTIREMASWNYGNSNILEVRFEDMMSNMHDVFQQILDFSGLTDNQIQIGMSIADREDISKKSDEEIKRHAHISSKNTTKWKEYFDDDIKHMFLEKFGDVLIQLGYEKDNDW